jgi:hypothetical protein
MLNNFIKISPNSIIYIVIPNIVTGGPEALHQLGLELKKKFDVRIYYWPFFNNNFLYQKYKIKFTNKIDDNKKNIIISAEHFTQLNFILKFKHIQKICWWLSVDNFLTSYIFQKKHKFIRSIIKIPLNLIRIFNFFTLGAIENPSVDEYLLFLSYFINLKKNKYISQFRFHLTQSHYSLIFLKKKKILNSMPISDYIDDDYFIKINNEKKENIICYNPSKRMDFANKVIKICKNLKFIPLKNLSKQNIIKTLKISKIYIDFGNHPGKDRIPREAAMLNNCVLTNQKGSAKYFEDLAIPPEFKFKENFFNLFIIKNKINYIIKNFEKEVAKFDQYKKKIKNEKKIFKIEINQLTNKFKVI